MTTFEYSASRLNALQDAFAFFGGQCLRSAHQCQHIPSQPEFAPVVSRLRGFLRRAEFVNSQQGNIRALLIEDQMTGCQQQRFTPAYLPFGQSGASSQKLLLVEQPARYS